MKPARKPSGRPSGKPLPHDPFRPIAVRSHVEPEGWKPKPTFSPRVWPPLVLLIHTIPLDQPGQPLSIAPFAIADTDTWKATPQAIGVDPSDALLRAREKGKEKEKEFWNNLYKEEKEATKEQLGALRPQETSAKTALSKSLGELRLVSPQPIMELAEALGAIRNQYFQWGRPWEREEELDRQRSELVRLIRTDLQISKLPKPTGE